MNIAFVNVVGNEGSTGKIATKLANYFEMKGHHCKIFYGRGQRVDDKHFIKHGCIFDNALHYVLSRITGKEGFYSTLFTKLIIRDIEKFSPQWIITLNLHGHWLNIPLFMKEISKMDVRVTISMPDEFIFTARCEYTDGCDKYMNKCIGCDRYKNVPIQFKAKKDYYEKLLSKSVFTSVEYIINKASKSSLLKGARFDIVNTGIDVDYYYPVDIDRIKKELQIDSNKIVLLDVAPYTNKRKGVEFFLEVARKMENDDRYVFVNVGFDGDKSIAPRNFFAIPYVSDQKKLREIYSMADCYICTSVQDALPNACVEAMSCGTPVVAFNVSGMPYLAKYPVLKLVSEIKVDKLIEIILSIKKKDEKIINESRKQAIERYAFTKNADRILNEYYDILSKCD